MPFKTPEARRANYRKRREDSEQLAKQRAYHRAYTKRRRKEDPVHAAKQLAYQRAWLAKHGSYYVKRGPRKKRTPEEEHIAFLERKRRFNKKHKERLNKENRERHKKKRIENPEYYAAMDHKRYLKHGHRRNFVARARRYALTNTDCYLTSDD